MISRVELEKALRAYEPLKGVVVSWPEPVKQALAPTLYVVSGIVSIKGEIRAYELEVDGRSFTSPSDVEMLVKALLHSFEKAERQLTQQAAVL